MIRRFSTRTVAQRADGSRGDAIAIVRKSPLVIETGTPPSDLLLDFDAIIDA